MVDFSRKLPVEGLPYDLRGFVGDLVEQLKQNISKNNLALPLLQTFNVLLEGDALDMLTDDNIGLKRFENSAHLKINLSNFRTASVLC